MCNVNSTYIKLTIGGLAGMTYFLKKQNNFDHFCGDHRPSPLASPAPRLAPPSPIAPSPWNTPLLMISRAYASAMMQPAKKKSLQCYHFLGKHSHAALSS